MALIVVCITLNNDLVKFEQVLVTPSYAPLSAMFIAGVIIVVSLVGFIGVKCENGKVLVAVSINSVHKACSHVCRACALT